jgi:hypothetical protein
MTMKARALSICLLALLAVSLARGQQLDQDQMAQNFFPPDLVMKHQEAIGLSEEQKGYLKGEIRSAQLKFTEWQFKLQDETEKMLSLAKQPHIEEKDALAQLEKVLVIERDIKRLQVTLLVHIKNNLTPDQQSKLAELRSKGGD